MTYVYDDGGRTTAGYCGNARDCVVRAIAIAAERDYQLVYDEIHRLGQAERPKRGVKRSAPRTGVRKVTIRRYLASLDWIWTPTMRIGTTRLRAADLPAGRLVVQVSKHLTAVIDGVIHDTADPQRGGTRCVYGYWTTP